MNKNTGYVRRISCWNHVSPSGSFHIGQYCRNEIIYALNQAEKFILAIVIVDGDSFEGPFYVKEPFEKEPDFNVVSINYELDKWLSKAVAPDTTLQGTSENQRCPRSILNENSTYGRS